MCWRHDFARQDIHELVSQVRHDSCYASCRRLLLLKRRHVATATICSPDRRLILMALLAVRMLRLLQLQIGVAHRILRILPSLKSTRTLMLLTFSKLVLPWTIIKIKYHRLDLFTLPRFLGLCSVFKHILRQLRP